MHILKYEIFHQLQLIYLKEYLLYIIYFIYLTRNVKYNFKYLFYTFKKELLKLLQSQLIFLIKFIKLAVTHLVILTY